MSDQEKSRFYRLSCRSAAYQHQEIIGLLPSAELDKKVKAMQNAQRYIEQRIEHVESIMNVKTA